MRHLLDGLRQEGVMAEHTKEDEKASSFYSHYGATMDYLRIKKTKTKLRYKGINIDTLQNMQWYPKIYKDPFKFNFEKVKQRMLDAKEAGYSDDVSTIKRNILRVTRDNPGVFDQFLELLEV